MPARIMYTDLCIHQLTGIGIAMMHSLDSDKEEKRVHSFQFCSVQKIWLIKRKQEDIFFEAPQFGMIKI